MKKTITIYSDPGHGWAKVSRKELESLGILNMISSYSYQRGDFVYLEEDMDLGIYVDALRTRAVNKMVVQFDIQWNEKVTNKTSKIRGYHHFSVSQ